MYYEILPHSRIMMRLKRRSRSVTLLGELELSSADQNVIFGLKPVRRSVVLVCEVFDVHAESAHREAVNCDYGRVRDLRVRDAEELHAVVERRCGLLVSRCHGSLAADVGELREKLLRSTNDMFVEVSGIVASLQLGAAFGSVGEVTWEVRLVEFDDQGFEPDVAGSHVVLEKEDARADEFESHSDCLHSRQDSRHFVANVRVVKFVVVETCTQVERETR